MENSDRSDVILVIDPNRETADFFLRNLSLREFSYRVETAASAREGLQKIKQNKYNLLLINYSLTDGDGISLLRHLYDQYENMLPWPVIIMATKEYETLMTDALRHGAHDYLLKDNLTLESLNASLDKARQTYILKQASTEAETKLLLAQKMEAMGELAGGIAHDFNNLLTIIGGNARLVSKMLEEDNTDIAACKKRMDTILQSSQRSAGLVKQLMMFARQREPEKSIVDINILLSDIQALLETSLGETIKIHTHLEADLWPILVDTNQLENAIINMCVNARDAMPDGGDLFITTTNIAAGQANYPDGIKGAHRDHVMISVRDTGYGMDENVRDKVFEPFFTTKDMGKGTGLGLSMVYSLVHEAGGHVTLESVRGQGACFKIYLPRTHQAANEASTAAPKEVAPCNGAETILIVEDEKDIRDLTGYVLRDCGYDVIEASNGDEAIKIFEERKGVIDLIFTDIMMPGEINGINLAARALVLKPDVDILFTTGYTTETMPDYGLIEDQYTMLDKPYNHDDLTVVIRSILDSKEKADQKAPLRAASY